MQLRAQKSALLGFSTHADFILEMNMAKSGKKVAAFLGEPPHPTPDRVGREEPTVLLPVCPPEELARKLKPLGDEERCTILQLKEKESQKRKLAFSGQLHAWDMRYYMTQVTSTPLRRRRRVAPYFTPLLPCRWRRPSTPWTRTC